MDAIKEVAQSNGISEEEVRKEIETAVEEGMRRYPERWRDFKYEGERPTAEEVVDFLQKTIKD